ncbi:hypothetical protein AM587_10001309 [Phytophthora nicotianae]|uniref:Uncharacterized protein n=1 Tax=Phytophthora nicotianae TaxID=4792 RepID=A0A0W8CHB8_PHYNI|nr:hypothetical protein AM587_10001309 [Phytophthora nicotianae]
MGNYISVKSRNQSGKNADDLLDDTHALFDAQEDYSFAFESCWQPTIFCTSDAESRGNGVTMEEMNRPEEMKKSKLALAANTEESSLLK